MEEMEPLEIKMIIGGKKRSTDGRKRETNKQRDKNIKVNNRVYGIMLSCPRSPSVNRSLQQRWEI